MRNRPEYTYSQAVQKNGAEYGFKTANLINLQEVLREFSGKSGDVAVEVPTFQGLSDKDVKTVLSVVVPDWEERWQQFVEQFNKDNDNNVGSSKILSQASLNILSALQSDIELGFVKNANSIFTEKNRLTLSPGLTANMLMIRSTGREDNVDVANPGGNASYPSKNDPLSVSQAIGTVISSYFDKKSLSQRLAAGLDITETPFVPILMQNLVGEGVSSDSGMITSGVIYSKDGTTRIDAAPGHGELVVNSKGPVDSFYITRTGVIFPERRAKPFRIKPVFDEDTGKLSLEMVQNSINNEYEFCMDEKVVRSLRKLAQYIEEQYGMPMDTEFAYDHEKETIYVVQTRPLTKGKTVDLIPSALNAELVDRCISKHTGGTITTAINTASVIKDKKEILVCNSIEEALNYYLHDPNGKNIKAVVVKNYAPSTSHEAGEFNSLAIPVIQVNDISAIESTLVSVKEQHLVIDPQRKTLFQLPKSLSVEGTGVLKEGLFKSSLSSEVSLFNHRLPGAVTLFPPIEISEDGKRISKMLIGVNSADEKTAEQNMHNLLKYIHSNIDSVKPFTEPALEEKGEEKTPDRLNMHAIQAALDQIQNLSQDNIAQNRANLARIMRSIYALRKSKIVISNALFKQIMITGAAALAVIDEINKQDPGDPSNHPLYSEYLDIYEKLYGMINGNGNEEILGNCLRAELAQRKLETKALHFSVEGKRFKKDERKAFTESLKFSKYCLNGQLKEKWENFCLEACMDDEDRKALITIIGNIAHMGIQEKWINTSFATQAGDHKTILNNMSRELQVIQDQKPNLVKIDSIILSLKTSTELWKNPEKFNALFKDMQSNLAYIRDNTKFDPNEPLALQIIKTNQMNEAVDAMDLILKSLSTSGLYGSDEKGKTTQADNFGIVLQEFYKLLVTWSKGHGNKEARDAILLKAKLLIDDAIFSGASPRDLSLSGGFNVSTANINVEIPGRDGWNRILNRCRTLQDTFTLLHQNLINVISGLTNNINTVIKAQLPPEVINIVDRISRYSFMTSRDQSTTSDLLTANVEASMVKLQYNLPLRNHSAMFDIIYDNNTKKTTLNFITFGHNNNGRWTFAAEALNYDLEQKHSIKFTKKANYDVHSQFLSFSIDISELTSEQLEALLSSISHNCTQLSFSGLRGNPVTLELLQELFPDRDKFDALTSLRTIEAYNEGIKIEDLKELAPDKIRALTSKQAIETYRSDINRGAFAELKELNADIISLLTSNIAAAAYQSGKVSVRDLLAADIIGIKRNILRAYAEHICMEAKEGLNYIDGLADNVKIDLLLSPNALNLYRNGKATVQDLASLDIPKIELLILSNVMDIYTLGDIKVQDLLAQDIIDIKRNILRTYAERICKEPRERLDYINRLEDVAKIDQLLSPNALTAYKEGWAKIQDLIDFDMEKIDLLIQKQALDAYRTGKIKAQDLKLLTMEEINLLISDQAIKAYETNNVAAQNLIGLGMEKIKLLISNRALETYKLGGATIQFLASLDIEAIDLLTSGPVVDEYIFGLKAQELIGLSREKIELLTSRNADHTYINRFGLKAQELIGLSREKIELLMSRNAEQTCILGKLKVRDLSGLDIRKIELLTSDQALAVYRTFAVKPGDLIGLDIGKINLLISNEALETYKNWHTEDHSKLDNLSAKDSILIKVLSSAIGTQLFQKGASGARQEDVKLIESVLADVVNNIKSRNPKFDIAALDPGEIKHGLLGKIQADGLSKMFYDRCSYTPGGYLTKGIYLPKSKLTEQFKNHVASYMINKMSELSANTPYAAAEEARKLNRTGKAVRPDNF